VFGGVRMKVAREILYDLYVVQGLSQKAIAEKLNVSFHQVKSSLRRCGIRKRPLKLGDKIYDNKEWLYNEYIVKQKGYTVIANELGVSYTTILDRILYFGWKLKGHNEIDKAFPRKGKKHSKASIEKIKQTRVRKRIKTTCNNCGNNIVVVKSKFNNSKHNYCSTQCFHDYLIAHRVETEDVTNSAAYKEWRLKVYKRDGYRCKMPGCNSKSRDIAAHHVYPKKQYSNKQFEVSNGITLCRPCHELTYGKENQFIDALVRVIQEMNDK
jgi:hypothetical protein